MARNLERYYGDYRTRDYDRDMDQRNRGYDRDYGYGYGGDYDRDYDRGSRRGYDRGGRFREDHEADPNAGRDAYASRRFFYEGRTYPSDRDRNWNDRNEDRNRARYGRDYGQPYDRDYDRDYNRDYDWGYDRSAWNGYGYGPNDRGRFRGEGDWNEYDRNRGSYFNRSEPWDRDYEPYRGEWQTGDRGWTRDYDRAEDRNRRYDRNRGNTNPNYRHREMEQY
ncbi:MAG TPA: hypothetical protein VFG50_09770 [Rhodothermales bacterium]|nr:hypothetical protein [Rhodothermales bacterium]